MPALQAVFRQRRRLSANRCRPARGYKCKYSAETIGKAFAEAGLFDRRRTAFGRRVDRGDFGDAVADHSLANKGVYASYRFGYEAFERIGGTVG